MVKILLFLIAWYTIGAVCSVFGQIKYEKEMLVKDIPNCAIMAFLGPLLLIFIAAVEISSHLEKHADKRLF